MKMTINGKRYNSAAWYLMDGMEVCEDPAGWLRGVYITDEQESRLVYLGLIEIV